MALYLTKLVNGQVQKLRVSPTKAIYRGYWAVIVGGFVGTSVTCNGVTKFIGSSRRVAFNIITPGTYTFTATRQGTTITKEVVLNDDTQEYIINLSMFIGVQQLEYIESTGAQYIDTGLILDYRYSVEATVKLINVKSGQSVLGARNSGSIGTGASFGFTSERYLAIDWFSGTRYSPNIKMELDINYKIKIQDNVFSLTNMDTGNVITTNTFNGYMSSQYKLFIFVLNDGGTPSVSNNTSRIKHVAIKDQNGVLVRDFIPVLDFDGTPCMYDKVEGKFYYNQGTGQFVAGPEKQ